MTFFQPLPYACDLQRYLNRSRWLRTPVVNPLRQAAQTAASYLANLKPSHPDIELLYDFRAEKLRLLVAVHMPETSPDYYILSANTLQQAGKLLPPELKTAAGAALKKIDVYSELNVLAVRSAMSERLLTPHVPHVLRDGYIHSAWPDLPGTDPTFGMGEASAELAPRAQAHGPFRPLRNNPHNHLSIHELFGLSHLTAA